MTINTLITHSGAFHADDLFAYSVLHRLFPKADLIRTRDQSLISSTENAIVFDVGNKYDPERNLYDHHQADKPLREPGLAYSSFGLIWKHFGVAYIQSILPELSKEDAEAIQQRLDNRIVRDIDAIDNGTPLPDQKGVRHPMGIASMLMDFRPDFDDDEPLAMDEGFQRGAFMAISFLKAKVRKAAATLRSEKIVKEAIENRVHPNWIELPRGMNYMGPILELDEAEEILYVVNPSDNEWQLNAVNVSAQSYDMRKALPEAWAARRDEDLAAVTGVKDAVFAHAGLFIAIARSREGIMSMLEQALERDPNDYWAGARPR